jgi:hypothetical protein
MGEMYRQIFDERLEGFDKEDMNKETKRNIENEAKNSESIGQEGSIIPKNHHFLRCDVYNGRDFALRRDEQ